MILGISIQCYDIWHYQFFSHNSDREWLEEVHLYEQKLQIGKKKLTLRYFTIFPY